jgi:hypothetical protein
MVMLYRQRVVCVGRGAGRHERTWGDAGSVRIAVLLSRPLGRRHGCAKCCWRNYCQGYIDVCERMCVTRGCSLRIGEYTAVQGDVCGEMGRSGAMAPL